MLIFFLSSGKAYLMYSVTDTATLKKKSKGTEPDTDKGKQHNSNDFNGHSH